MRLTKPRIEALVDAQLDADAQALIAPIASRGRVLNIFRTLCNHSGLAKRWMVFANHILGKSTLDPKERELVILRIGFLCNAGYEWGQHVVIARQVGLTDEEILLAKSGPRSPGISTLHPSTTTSSISDTRMTLLGMVFGPVSSLMGRRNWGLMRRSFVSNKDGR